jgi:hypothetical protein
MTSKHYGWQRRWAIDRAAGTGRHECGLAVRYSAGRIVADNQAATIAELSVKHGHNAAAMVARMLREAEALFQGAPYGRA